MFHIWQHFKVSNFILSRYGKLRKWKHHQLLGIRPRFYYSNGIWQTTYWSVKSKWWISIYWGNTCSSFDWFERNKKTIWAKNIQNYRKKLKNAQDPNRRHRSGNVCKTTSRSQYNQESFGHITRYTQKENQCRTVENYRVTKSVNCPPEGFT